MHNFFLLKSSKGLKSFSGENLAGCEGTIWDCSRSQVEEGRKQDEQDSFHR
jgi:hypothetical protein